MDYEGVMSALQSGDFDGIQHEYSAYKGYGKHTTHWKSILVSGSVIELTTTTRGKSFDGKENNWYEEDTVKYLSGNEALEFILTHPYYFKQRRPNLF